ncbi:MAG: tRNA (adenosine(37)-N6)-threonylcarbamoyltransferase complex dimerization subunit type 1 TsaB [Thermoleophilia bacterium]
MSGTFGGRRLVLALDTSSAAGVSLFELAGDEFVLRASRQHVVAGMQTSMLLELVERALEEVKARPGDLGAVVVGTGPGTFTGVRIGVASARAVALALDIPVLGVSSLSALAAAAVDRGVPDTIDVVVPVVDARRGQVFAGVYRRGEDRGLWAREGDPFAAAPDDLEESVAKKVGRRAEEDRLIVGHVGLLSEAAGAERVTADVEAAYLVQGHSRIGAADASEGRSMLGWLARAIATDLRASDCGSVGELGTPESVRPTYVRAPDADRHIKKMRDPWQT